MLQTLEAEIYPGGQIQFLEKFALDHKVRAYVTILTESETPKETADWHQFVGVLQDSTIFDGDPVDIQRAMRDEWA
ncbi:hypothetical protein [Thiomicrospira sp. ALE5]|uniref:hypothetical protein n=1 Tax=Thiomicrospira sp. ALE5 TaxID=748650 RepID=UPI0008EC2592|nr:hypothetical protein [Thiomicrospira sp. ALE5]SFR49331.1 hypothetical protein SAMN03092900_0141 [Thiomicrospira sp. ALE5]